MGAYLSNCWDQSYPPAPRFTDKEVPDLSGKVFIVTGGASGVGYELVKLLYRRHGTVYIAGRSEEKGLKAIDKITAAETIVDPPKPGSGALHFLFLDLDDLTAIKDSAENFMRRETRLDVLWNNAGVMLPPVGSQTAQGYELQLGTNCVAPFLFTKLLLSVLQHTATLAPAGSVRIAWAGSLTLDMFAPTTGMDLDDLMCTHEASPEYLYAQSKAGNLFLASAFAKKLAKDRVVSVAFNPGNLRTRLARHLPFILRLFLLDPFLHDAIYGAYTELYAGLSPDVTLNDSGAYILPWGRIHDWSRGRTDIAASLKSEAEGGNGKAEMFYQWCEAETKRYT